MKSIIVIFLFCSYVFAMKDQDSPYKFKIDGMEFKCYSNEYFDWGFTLFKLNRSTNALNGTLNIAKELPPNTYVHYQIYEFRNNEYRPFAMNVKRLMCDFIKNEYGLFMFPELRKFPGSVPMPVECPVKPGNYWFYNYVPDAGAYPFLPMKKIKSDITYLIGNKRQLSFILYLILDRDVIYRERFG